jgi:hypothetical protein
MAPSFTVTANWSTTTSPPLCVPPSTICSAACRSAASLGGTHCSAKSPESWWNEQAERRGAGSSCGAAEGRPCPPALASARDAGARWDGLAPLALVAGRDAVGRARWQWLPADVPRTSSPIFFAMVPEMGGGRSFWAKVVESGLTMVLALHMFDEMARTTVWGNITTFLSLRPLYPSIQARQTQSQSSSAPRLRRTVFTNTSTWAI